MYTRYSFLWMASRFAEQAYPILNIAAAGAVEIRLLSVAPLIDDQASSVVDMYRCMSIATYMVDPTSEAIKLRTKIDSITAC